MPPRNRSTGVKVWGRRTGLRHVYDQDRPELLFRCRNQLRSTSLEGSGVQKNGQRHGLNPCQVPLTPSLLILLPSPQKKRAYFYLSPGNRNVNPRKVIMWVKMPMIFQSEVKERGLDPPIVLAHTKRRGVLEQPGIRDPKTTGNIWCRGGEFHPGIYPKAAALFKTHRPAGWGGHKGRLLAYSKSERENPPANHFRPHLGGRQPVLFSYIGDSPQQSLKPKHIFMKGGLDKEPLGSAAMGLLPSSFHWFQLGRERAVTVWDSMTSS